MEEGERGLRQGVLRGKEQEFYLRVLNYFGAYEGA